MIGFVRRATIAAALLAAPLGLAVLAASGPQALATRVPAAVSTVDADQTVVSQGLNEVAGSTEVTAEADTGATSAGGVTFTEVRGSKKKRSKAPTSKPTTNPTTTPTTKPTTPTTPATTPAATGNTALENEVVRLTNVYRVANGCGALRVDSRLVTSARAHSADMVNKNFFSHTGSDGSNFVTREVRAGYTTGASAENIAWGYRTAKEVVDGWINSAGHRANILNCSSIAVGVGMVKKADGTPYWTQNFGRI